MTARTRKNLEDHLSKDPNNDGIDRRGFLKWMVWPTPELFAPQRRHPQIIQPQLGSATTDTAD